MIDRDNRRLENLAYNAWDSINELMKSDVLTDEQQKQFQDTNESLADIERKHHGMWVENEQMDGWGEDE